SIGMGTGTFEKTLQDLGVNVVGTDSDKAFVKIAQNKGVKLTKVADGHNLPFKDNEFGSIFFSESIENMDADRALAEANRVLKTGGKVFIASNIGDDNRKMLDTQQSGNVLRDALSRNGFQAIEMNTQKGNNDTLGEMSMTFVEAKKNGPSPTISSASSKDIRPSSPIDRAPAFKLARSSTDSLISSPVVQESGINSASLFAGDLPLQHILTMAAPPPPRDKKSAGTPPPEKKPHRNVRDFSKKRTVKDGGSAVTSGNNDKSSFKRVFRPSTVSSPATSLVFPTTIAHINLADISNNDQPEQNTFASSPAQDRNVPEFKTTTPSIGSTGGRGWFSGGGQETSNTEGSIVPISDTEKVISQKAKGFGKKNVEFMGIFRGTGPDKLNELVLPRVIGIESSRRTELDVLSDLEGPVSTMLALDGRGNLGIQIVASKYNMRKGFLEGREKFISLDHLILNKPLAQFMSQKDRQELFPGMDVKDISEKHLIDMITRSRDKRQMSYMTNGKERKIEEVVFVPTELEVDMFGTDRSYHPTNRFIKNVLSQNRFDNGAHFGDVHTHYGFPEQEIAKEPYLQELFASDRRFPELLTPYDAVALKGSKDTMKVLGLDNTQAILRGIIWMDQENKNVRGSTYFDLTELSEDEAAFNEFDRLSTRALETEDTEDIKKYFAFVRQFSHPQRPDYASSPVTSQVSSRDSRSSSPIGDYQKLALPGAARKMDGLEKVGAIEPKKLESVASPAAPMPMDKSPPQIIKEATASQKLEVSTPQIPIIPSSPVISSPVIQTLPVTTIMPVITSSPILFFSSNERTETPDRTDMAMMADTRPAVGEITS
ncbi:MAG: class I SAM-dependent methyltransferase, partial [Candidatus Omnitrophica bacterium]|nr:class I SAM-dependent methyltransferase [Candidatus Omnitrophota bacterium]